MVTAVIVTFNPDLNLLVKQNEILSSQVEIIIYVDNGSTNAEEIEKLLNPNKSVVIYNNKNIGLGGAQNIGIKNGVVKNTDFILLFDQDSLPSQNFVKSLLDQYIEASKFYKVGLIGPVIRNIYKGATKDEEGVIISGFGFKRAVVDSITDVSYCIASGSLIPVEVFCEVGYIEERLFIDGMDLEWCFRAKSKGYHIIQTNKAFLEHCLGNGKEDRILSHNPTREYYIVRNDIWISKQRHIPVGYRIRKKITPYIRIAYNIVCGRFNYISQGINGLIDGIKK